MLAGRAEAVAIREDCSVFHSARLSIDVPSIVRLSHMVRIPRWARTPPVTRRSVLRRDGGLCVYCSQPADTIDHVIPRQQGRDPRLVQCRRRLQARQPGEGRPAPLRAGLDDACQAGSAGRAPLAVASPVGCGPVVGAVSRCGVLRLAFSRVPLRRRAVPPPGERFAVAREVTVPTLVLGSTQPTELVDAHACGTRCRAGAAARRGRSGVPRPGEQLWLDAWIPRDDPLWVVDVSAAAEWVGAWWTAALAGSGSTASRCTGAGRCPARSAISCASPAADRARCSRAAARWWASRSGGPGRGPCSPRAPTCTGTRRRCWRCSMWERTLGVTWRAAWQLAAAGLADLEPGGGDWRRCGPIAAFAPRLRRDGAAGRLRRPASRPLPPLPPPLAPPFLPLVPPAAPGWRAAPRHGRRNSPGGGARRAVGDRFARAGMARGDQGVSVVLQWAVVVVKWGKRV